MGTNYYLRENCCDHCNRWDELHIGKSSFGWCFSLHIIPGKGILSLDDWVRRWKGGQIWNEYGERIEESEMISIIKREGWKPPEGVADQQWLRRNGAQLHPDGWARAEIGSHCSGWGDGPWDYILGDFS